MSTVTKASDASASGRRIATMIGFSAVLMWALLAVLTASSGTLPPFQLTAITFAIGGALGALRWISHPEAWRALRAPWQVWALGIGGLFGYHFLYFTALRNSPPIDASLIAYLWPLLIVVFSALLPGERLKAHHVIGALMGLAGAALIVTRGQLILPRAEYVFGYLAALGCAFTWSIYSLLSRRLADVPTDTVTGFCLATAVLSAVAHLALETTVWPTEVSQWLAIIGLGLMPVGLAFYTWDYGVKRGDIQILGASAYASPLLSTIVLIIAGHAELSLAIVGAALMITLGAVLAARDLLFPSQKK
jgi:drug/metabolite transporter (DMT)-like permease